jgi:hypothetical protein
MTVKGVEEEERKDGVIAKTSVSVTVQRWRLGDCLTWGLKLQINHYPQHLGSTLLTTLHAVHQIPC